MSTSRRSFLQMALSPLVISALGSREVLGAPAIIKPELTPQQFGATGGDPVADTLAWNRAMIEASQSGRPIMAKGTYVLRAAAESNWSWHNRDISPTHVAVQLRSNVQVFGNNAEILVGQPEKPVAAEKEHHYLFGTGLNVKPGSLKNIRFEGLNFDFREEFGTPHRPTYAFGIVSVDGFERHNLTIRSSGKQGGRGLAAQNLRNRVDRGLKFINIEQGMYTQYEYGVTMEDLLFDGFDEAIDFEGPAWDVNLRKLTFRNGSGDANCIDTAGGARWNVSEIDAESVGSIIFIYNKSTSWPTYEAWLNSGDGKGNEKITPDFIPAENFSITGVRGHNVGLSQRKRGRDNAAKSETLRIGNPRARNTHSYFGDRKIPSPRNITIEDWQLDGCYRMTVNDCENLTMRNLRLSNVRMPDDEQEGAAITFREAGADLGGAITGSVQNLRIDGSDGMGVSIIGCSGLKIEDVTIKNFDRQNGTYTAAAVRIRQRQGSSAALAQIKNLSVSGGPDGVPAIDSLAAPAERSPKDKNDKIKPKRDRGTPKKVPVS